MNSRDNRWQINKLGIINFWYYDKEEFYLDDGKLLLRGGNGSGKSVTLQSFIPLLLDGNRTPSRLDPFGSSSRKLENYMLMNEHENERTAYLYMELKKRGIENYISVGMGIKAQKDKPLETWYFIVRDGRRIGIDFNLTKKTTEGYLILQKKELQNQLKENSFFTDSQSKYMEKMNEIFFGFSDISNYQDLLSLIINIRAPKLSKDLKPTKMYEILNRSLKTIDEEELRSVTDAIEEMERINNKIEDQKKSLVAVREIEKIYQSYNITILSIKFSKYQEEKLIYENDFENFQNMKKDYASILLEIENIQKNLVENQNKRATIEARITALKKNDLFWNIQETNSLKDDIDKLKNDFKRREEKKEEKIHQLRKKQRELDKLESDLKELAINYSKVYVSLDSLLKSLNFSFLPDSDDLKEELKRYKEFLKNLRKDISLYESLNNSIKNLDDDIEKNRLDLLKENQENQRLQTLIIETTEQLKEEVLIWNENNSYLKFSHEDNVFLSNLINIAIESNKIENIHEFLKEKYRLIKNKYLFELELIKNSLNKEKIEKKLLKDNIPFEYLKNSTGLDIFLVNGEAKSSVNSIISKEGGHFLVTDDKLIKNSNDIYNIGNLIGKSSSISSLTQNELEEIINTLEKEFSLFPSLENLNAGQTLLQESADKMSILEKITQSLKTEKEKVEKEIAVIDKKLFPLLKETQIKKNIASLDSFENIREEAYEFSLELTSLKKDKILKQSQQTETNDNIISLEEEIEEESYYLKELTKNLSIKEHKLNALNETLKTLDSEGILEEIADLDENNTKLKKLETNLNRELGRCENSKVNFEQSLEKFENKILLSSNNLEKFKKYYYDELELGYAIESDISLSIKENGILKIQLELDELLNKYGNILQNFHIKKQLLFQENIEANRINLIYMQDGKENSFLNLAIYLSNQIENLEILITSNNKKIFEETLLETLGSKVLAEINKSKRWIKEINRLMSEIESSSSLKLELKWEAKKSEAEGELNTEEITAILSHKDRISENELTKFRDHFSKKLKTALRISKNENINSSCHAVVKELIDYREWFDFKLFYTKKNEKKKEMTNNNFEQFSGGEKAISMYLPLLAALYARYESASPFAPRIVAMDEAFAGVDEKNISLLFSHLEKLELDYILNSQILWGDYNTIPKLAITEILRDENDTIVTLINYKWNGNKIIERDEYDEDTLP